MSSVPRFNVAARKLLSVATLFLAFTLAGCPTIGQYVWADDYHSPDLLPPTSKGYVIAPGDVISVRVFNQEQMSGKERVRSDGKVSLPFLNDVAAAGFTPQALAAQLQTRLKEFINAPVVTVTVEEPRGVPVSVAGEVLKPGLYSLEAGSGVLQALVMAGGLNEYAGRDRIFVLRQRGGATARIRFRYRSLARADGAAGAFQLRPGDTVVVE